MTENEERAYESGGKAAWLAVLSEAGRHLGRSSPEWNEKRWVLEREAAIAELRDLCAEFGGNNWPDDLHLADIIKRIRAHLLTP